MEIQAPNRLFRIPEVGARLALSRSSVYREIEAGNLKAVQIGRSKRITAEELERYIESLSVATSKNEVA